MFSRCSPLAGQVTQEPPRTSHSTTSTHPPSPTTSVGSLAEARSAQACLGTTTTAADSSSHCFVSWTWPPQTPSSPFLKLFLILAQPGPISSPPPWGPRGHSVGWAANDSSLAGGSHSLPPAPMGAGQQSAAAPAPPFPGTVSVPASSPRGDVGQEKLRAAAASLGHIWPSSSWGQGALGTGTHSLLPIPWVLASVPESSYN